MGKHANSGALSFLDQVSTFAADKVIGKGSFGVVYKARNLETKETVAIKKVYQDRRFKNRELQIMRRIKHPNIVELKNYYFSTSSNKDVYLNMILEYVPDSLFQASHGYIDKQSDVPTSVVQLYMFQLLRALAYIHSRNICHRDIKPQNVLVNAMNGSASFVTLVQPSSSFLARRTLLTSAAGTTGLPSSSLGRRCTLRPLTSGLWVASWRR